MYRELVLTLRHRMSLVYFLRYMLTVEGREVAKECIMRSGLSNSHDNVSDDEMDFAQPFADPKSKADSAGPSRAYDLIFLVRLLKVGCSILRSLSYKFTGPVEILSDDEIDLVHPHANPKSKAYLAGRTCMVISKHMI